MSRTSRFRCGNSLRLLSLRAKANDPIAKRVLDNDPGMRRSERVYDFGEAEEETIIQTLGFHRRDYDLAVTSFSDNTGFPSMPDPQMDSSNPTMQMLRLATCFPVEVMHMILRQCSFEDICRFRLTNSYSLSIVDDIPEIRTLLKYAPQALRAVLETRCGRNYNIEHMVSVLHDPHCWKCGEFGNWVFLPWFVRTCFVHFDEEFESGFQDSVQFLRPGDTNVNVVKDQKETLTLKPVPGKYWMDQYSIKDDGLILVSTAPDRLHWPGKETDQPELNSRPKFRPANKKHLHFTKQEDFVIKLATVAVLPFVNRTDGREDSGVSCKGCNGPHDVRNSVGPDVEYRLEPTKRLANHVFSHEGFLAHVRYCLPAQRLWEKSERGRKTLKDDRFVSRGGYFNDTEDISEDIKYHFWRSSEQIPYAQQYSRQQSEREPQPLIMYNEPFHSISQPKLPREQGF